jgi:hypothetical protein
MEKIGIYLVVVVSLVFIFLFYGIAGAFIGFGQPTNGNWYNISWHYRIRIEINTTQYSVVDWPVEKQINFSELMPSGTFDINSIRVFEYTEAGLLSQEVPSQFDVDDGFNA